MLLDRTASDCATPVQPLDRFVNVAGLDAPGFIKRTWRRGDTPLAICVEREQRGETLPAPPTTPFPVSRALGFAP